MSTCSRRTFVKAVGASLAGAAMIPGRTKAAGQGGEAEPFRLHYLLASSLYGKVHIRDIVPHVTKAGCEALDVWCSNWVPHRTQVDEMGHDAFKALLKQHNTRLGTISPYRGGPFKVGEELRVVAKLGGTLAITGSAKAADDVKTAMKNFIERLKPQVEVAEEVGVDIGIENHRNALLWKPDSFRYFCEFATSPRLKISYAPFHLPQDGEMQGGLLREIGHKVAQIYMWQQPANRKTTEAALPAMPGPGGMDFTPIVAALKAVRFAGWSEIFTHAHKHDGAACATADGVTQEVLKSRAYLEACLAKA